MIEKTISKHTHAHTHTRLTALCPGLPRWASTRKVKPILKQETVSGSGISWAICKSAPCSRQITMPALHHSVFYRPDALPAAQPTVSKHWRQQKQVANIHKYSSRHVTNRKQVCVQLLRMLTTWHCPHLSAAVCHAAKFAVMAHAGTDRRTDG